MTSKSRIAVIIIFLFSAGAIALFANGYFEEDANSDNEPVEFPEPVLDDSTSSAMEENKSGSISIEINTAPEATPSPTIEPTLTPTPTPTSTPEATPLTVYYYGSGGGSSRSGGSSGGSNEQASSDPPVSDPTKEPVVNPTEQPTKKPTAEPAVEPTADPTDDPEDREKIPEFPTVIFPVISIIGLLLILRKGGI